MFDLKRTLAFFWTVGIVVALLIPGTTLGGVSVGISDLIAHAVLFAGYGLLWSLASPGQRITILITGLALGGLLEIAQWVLPINRGAEGLDWLADGTGLVMGILLATALASQKEP